jgi:hypothetical protein
VTRTRVPLALVGALLAAAVHVSAHAQTTKPGKVPPRPAPNVSATTGLPSGIDTGTPATSDSMPLGTPVPPVASADRSDQNVRSAAARAAARPTAAARRAGAKSDCPANAALASGRVGTVASGVDGGPAEAMASRDAPSVRTAKPEPRALPSSGFTGAANATAPAGRGSAADCG